MAEEKKKDGWLKHSHQLMAATAASLSYFVAGQIRGWASPAVPSLQGTDGGNASLSYAPLSKEAASWITSSPPIGAIPAALLASFALQCFGRRKTLLFASALYTVTFALLGTGSIHESYWVIIIARALTGAAVGLCMPAAQIYVAECSHHEIRGFLGSFPAFFMAMGVSATYCAGAFLPWNLLSYVCMVVPFLSGLLMIFMPESPVWLARKGYHTEAAKSASWLSGQQQQKQVESDEKNHSLDTLSTTIEGSAETLKDLEAASKPKSNQKSPVYNGDTSSYWDGLMERKVMYPLMLSLTLMVLQQWSGVNAIIFYTVTIFSSANISLDEHLSSNIVGIVQLVATSLSIVLVDKAGRRILLMMSGFIMGISQAAIGAFFYLSSEGPVESLQWLPLTSLVLFMIGYSIGFASIPFLLMGELLPHRYRNFLGGLASSLNLTNNFLVLKLFPTLETLIGFHGVFWIYAATCVVSIPFVFLALPETKGKTLDEIEMHFEHKAKSVDK